MTKSIKLILPFIALLFAMPRSLLAIETSILNSKMESGFAIVELFTSEGCSSCPPADRLLSDLAEEASRKGKPIYALSFHVDYWNYLGWKDPFGRKEFSLRQEKYAQAMAGRIYTPQMIINGKEEFTGSDADKANSIIASQLAQKNPVAINLEVQLAQGKHSVTIKYRIAGNTSGILINLALVEKGLSISVKNGENGGRILHHDNVVRSFKTFKLEAATGQAELEIPEGVKLENASLIVYTQETQSLSVVAATRIGLH